MARQISDKTAGTSEAYIRTPAEILEQEKQKKEQEEARDRARRQKIKQGFAKISNFAKSVGSTAKNITEKVQDLGDKVAEASDSVKDPETKELLASVTTGLTSISADANDIQQSADSMQEQQNNEVATNDPTSENSKQLSDKSSEKGFIYVPESDKMDKIVKTINGAKNSGKKAKVLMYTPEQMSNMPQEFVSNIVSHGLALGATAVPALAIAEKTANAVSHVLPFANKVVRNKSLPELPKTDAGFIKLSLDFNAPDFDVTDYLTSEKDTSRLYTNAFDFGDVRQASIENTNETEHISAEERQARRDAKYGKADEGVDYNYGKDNEFGLVM